MMKTQGILGYVQSERRYMPHAKMHQHTDKGIPKIVYNQSASPKASRTKATRSPTAQFRLFPLVVMARCGHPLPSSAHSRA